MAQRCAQLAEIYSEQAYKQNGQPPAPSARLLFGTALAVVVISGIAGLAVLERARAGFVRRAGIAGDRVRAAGGGAALRGQRCEVFTGQPGAPDGQLPRSRFFW
jgi:hypothetical protein